MKVMHICMVLLTSGSVIIGGMAPSFSQDSPPAYLIIEVHVTDQAGFDEYAAKATETVARNGGDFIVMDPSPRAIEGEPPNGNVVVIRFPSMDAALTWLNSPEYGAVKGIRHRTAETRQILVGGLPAGQ